MATVGEQIRASFVTSLSQASVTLPSGATLSKPAGVTVERFRLHQVRDDVLENGILVVYPAVLGDNPVESVERISMGGRVQRWMGVRVEGLKAVPDGTAPDTALDDLYRWVVASILADRLRGGLAMDTIEVANGVEPDSADLVAAKLYVNFRVRYDTHERDPAALAA
jgi:hypothetical protein